jgi:hypothetical protein
MSKYPECKVFPEGSRKRLICEGKTGMSPRKINAMRDRWGIIERFQDNSPTPVTEELPQVRLTVHGFSVDERSNHTRYGAGTELLRMNKEAGFPHCPACEELAEKMNNMGTRWCVENIEFIVEDIFPRAKEWIAENKPWMHSLMPGVIEDIGIRTKLRVDISKAITTATAVIDGRLLSRSAGDTSLIARSDRKGCSSCGSRSAGRKPSSRGRSVLRDAPEHFSNLKLSTAFGPSEEPLGKVGKVKLLPFSELGITRNLLYHIYPHGDKWKWNLDQLLSRIDMFNGRKIIAIAIDKKSDSADAVRKYIGRNAHEYLVYDNSPRHGEMVSFIPSLAQLVSTNPDEITFRAHAKGVTQTTKKAEHIIDWTEMLYRTNLDALEEVEEHLSRFAMTGSCRKFDQFSKSRRRPTYSGTFYWFRNCHVYSRQWESVTSRRWGCEEWPSRMFSPEETGCLFLDNTNSMYSENYWKETVLPAYESWKSKRGLV